MQSRLCFATLWQTALFFQVIVWNAEKFHLESAETKSKVQRKDWNLTSCYISGYWNNEFWPFLCILLFKHFVYGGLYVYGYGKE